MLQEKVEELIGGLTGSVGIYYKDLTTGETAYAVKGAAAGETGGEAQAAAGPEIAEASASDRFESASVIKVPIMIEAFRQIEEGRIAEDTAVILRAEDKVPSGETPHYAEEWSAGRIAAGELFPESGVLNYMRSGLALTVRELITLMIVISDNTATNLLIDLLGKDSVNKTLEALGCTATRLNRKLFEAVPQGAPRAETENQISVREMGRLLEMMYLGELVSPRASREMAAILTNQQVNHKIPFFISQLPIAHKTGEDSGITNDVAVVYGEKPFILCLAANGTDVPRTERAYQDIAKILYEEGKGKQ